MTVINLKGKPIIKGVVLEEDKKGSFKPLLAHQRLGSEQTKELLLIVQAFLFSNDGILIVLS